LPINISCHPTQSKQSLILYTNNTDNESLHPYLEGVLVQRIYIITPKPLNGVAGKLPLVVDGVLSDVGLGESHSRCVVVETAHDLELADGVLALPVDGTLGHGGDVEVAEGHWKLLAVVDVVASPLASLHEVRHLLIIIQ
jgi:hypothetical protein